MIAIRIENQSDRLEKRRREISRTLDHVRGEQQTVDENKQWIGRSAYVKRCKLLDSLARWYADESRRIDAALRRINAGAYGVCVHCGERIDEERLEALPEATLCAECQQPQPLLRRA